MSGASSYRCIRAVGTMISGPHNRLILPALWRTHPRLLDARPEFEPGILALLQCSALRRPALPGLQSREHDPERLQGPRCEMQHKRQRHFAFVTSSLVNMALAAFYFLAGIIAARAARLSGLDTLAVEHGR